MLIWDGKEWQEIGKVWESDISEPKRLTTSWINARNATITEWNKTLERAMEYWQSLTDGSEESWITSFARKQVARLKETPIRDLISLPDWCKF